MNPDWLSFPSLPSLPAQPTRPSEAAAGAAPFASVYAEALQIEQQELSVLGSADSSETSTSPLDDLTAFLELRGASLSAGCSEGIPLTAQGGANGLIGEANQQQGNPPAPSDVGQLVGWLDSHAYVSSTHRCAASVRQAMEAAGISTTDRPASGDAGDYGPFLLRHGARVVQPESYEPQAGDIAVFDKTDDHPAGHIQVYDGHQWVSDFVQHTFSPYRDQESTPPVTVYRLS